jgi:hypothetical protein
MRESDIILTGIPRSGTTLTCHLINKLPNAVALLEPMDVLSLPSDSGKCAVCDQIENFFQSCRQSLREHGLAVSKHIEGSIPDNSMGQPDPISGRRMPFVGHGEISVEKSLSDDFLLVIKHPAMFTALLEELTQRFTCFAVVRNPLAVLASWNSVGIPVSTGHAPAAERFDSRLRMDLAGIADVHDQQLHLLSWFFEKYQILSTTSLLRYEDLIASSGKSLTALSPAAQQLSEPLSSKNRNQLYDTVLMELLREKLLAFDGAFWDYYTRESVEEL